MSFTDHGTVLAVGWETEFVGTAVQYTPDGIMRVAVYDLVAILAKLANESRAACKDHTDECDHITDAMESQQMSLSASVPVMLPFSALTICSISLLISSVFFIWV